MDDDDEITPAQSSAAEQRKDWPLVTADDDDGVRPAGKANECFYCQRLIGNPHKAGCVIVRGVFEVSFSLDLRHWRGS